MKEFHSSCKRGFSEVAREPIYSEPYLQSHDFKVENRKTVAPFSDHFGGSAECGLKRREHGAGSFWRHYWCDSAKRSVPGT